MDGGAGDPEAPITVATLADLQAGLLDDETAARVRQRVRDDAALAAQLAALDRVRRDVAALEADESSAQAVPPEVAERMAAALHAARPARLPGRAVTVVGAIAALAAVGIGAGVLLSPAAPTHSQLPTAEKLVAPPPTGFSLTQAQLVDLLAAPPDLGPLADPQRRASCLAGLGYPATTAVLGGRRFWTGPQPVVVLLVPGTAPKAVNVLVVRPNCSSADTGLLADTALNRP